MKSRRFYVVGHWCGEEIRLHDQEKGTVVLGTRAEDLRRFTRRQADDICERLNRQTRVEHASYSVKEDKE